MHCGLHSKLKLIPVNLKILLFVHRELHDTLSLSPFSLSIFFRFFLRSHYFHKMCRARLFWLKLNEKKYAEISFLEQITKEKYVARMRLHNGVELMANPFVALCRTLCGKSGRRYLYATTDTPIHVDIKKEYDFSRQILKNNCNIARDKFGMHAQCTRGLRPCVRETCPRAWCEYVKPE